MSIKLPFDYKPKTEITISSGLINNVKKIYKKITGAKKFKSYECNYCLHFTDPDKCPYPIKHPCVGFKEKTYGSNHK